MNILSTKNLAVDQTTTFGNARISKAPRHTTPALLSFPGLLKMMEEMEFEKMK